MSIIVIGMHRSGTSAITSVIQAMGVHVGHPADLLTPRRDNPKGYFERNDVLAVNRAIMQHHMCNWFDVSRYDQIDEPLPEELNEQMKAITFKLKGHSPFAMKDPRFCFTLPYWLPHLFRPVVVLALRHPAFIAHSLKIRNDIPEDKGMALWEVYMRRAMKNIEGLPVVRCQYEDLLEDPEAGAMKLYNDLSKHVKRIHKAFEIPIDLSMPSANPPFTTLTPRHQGIYDMARGLA